VPTEDIQKLTSLRQVWKDEEIFIQKLADMFLVNPVLIKLRLNEIQVTTSQQEKDKDIESSGFMSFVRKYLPYRGADVS
jgi:hypothetical protein